MPNQSNRYYLRKKYVHSCALENRDDDSINVYHPNSCYLIKKLFSLFVITKDVNRRKIYSQSNKVLEKERRTHLRNYWYIIHPFSDFAYYWQLLLIVTTFLQLAIVPMFILARERLEYSIYLILATQILSCFNIFVNCFTGHYREDIKEVVLDQKHILLNYLKSGNLIIDLLGGFPAPYISYLCGASLTLERFISCLIALNICPLMRNLELLREKRGFSFMVFRLLDAFLVLILGTCWLTILIFVGTRFDRLKEKAQYNVNVWWWVYNTYSFMYGTEVIDFFFVGYQFLFSTITIIFGILIRNVLLVQLILMCEIWHSSERKRSCLDRELNEFCHYKRLPFDLKQRLIHYYKFKLRNVYYDEAEIRNQLSENLRYNIKDYICRAWFEADIFKLCPLPLRQLITLHLDEEIYFKNDIIYQSGDLHENIYFIKSGSVLHICEARDELSEITEGNFFSEESLLVNYYDTHKSTKIALESSQLFKLSRSNFLTIIENFQSSYSTILDIIEKRRTYLSKKSNIKTRLKLGDYYHIARRNTDSTEETLYQYKLNSNLS